MLYCLTAAVILFYILYHHFFQSEFVHLELADKTWRQYVQPFCASINRHTQALSLDSSASSLVFHMLRTCSGRADDVSWCTALKGILCMLIQGWAVCRFWTSAVCESHVQTDTVAVDSGAGCDLDTGWRTDVADYRAVGPVCRQVTTDLLS